VVIGASTRSADPSNPDFISVQGIDNVYGPIKFNHKTSLVYNGGTVGDTVLIDATAISKVMPDMTSLTVNGGPSSDAFDVTGPPGPNLHIVHNGGPGDDALSGEADLHGGTGDDQLTGGDQIDGTYVIDGGEGDDTLFLNGSEDNDAVSMSFSANTLTSVI